MHIKQTFINIKAVLIVQKIDFIDTKILSHGNLQLSQNLQLPVGIGELHCSEHLKDGDLLVFIMGR